MYVCMQCLDPSEQLVAIILDMHYCSVFQDVLKKVSNVPKEAALRSLIQ